MKDILCYGDSNTWGYAPGTGERFSWERRWPGILQQSLGETFHIIEAGLNGRTTVFDDPDKAGCNGLTTLGPVLESCPLLAMVILMLGTNDLKYHLDVSAFDTAQGIERLVDLIEADSARAMRKTPQILIVSPPGIDAGSLKSGPLFKGALDKLREFPRLFAEVADNKGCHFLDAAQFVNPSRVDGVHLDERGHIRLAQVIARTVIEASGQAHLLYAKSVSRRSPEPLSWIRRVVALPSLFRSSKKRGNDV
jgi:lysophospholipase L1-like esterase